MKSWGFSKFYSLYIKQPCSSVWLKKALEMHQKCLNNAVPLLTKRKIEYFDLQQAFKMSYLAQILSAQLPNCLPACRKTQFRKVQACRFSIGYVQSHWINEFLDLLKICPLCHLATF